MTEPVIQTESVKVCRADALELLPTFEGGGEVVQAIITDVAYWTLNKWRGVGTTTRLGGHRDASKRTGWFETIDRDELYTLLCELSRLLPKNGHAWLFADNEVQSIIQGFVREGETGFSYVKTYPVLKMTQDGTAPRMGMGYHLKGATEFVVLCEKGRRRWSNDLNNRPDFFMVPWIGDAETRRLTKDGKPYPTAKPWMLYRWLVQLSSSEGETILDPFAGSGPLIPAALAEARKAILIDKSADAIDVMRRRLDPARARRDLERIEREIGWKDDAQMTMSL